MKKDIEFSEEFHESIMRAFDVEATSKTIEALTGMTLEQIAEEARNGGIVPKQELPVIPRFVAYVIEAYKSNSRLTNLLADLAFHGGLAEFVEHEDEDEVFEWARSNRKATDEILARAWLYGYEVEAKQRYYVKIMDKYLTDKGLGIGITFDVLYTSGEKMGYQQQFTEQEIKGYDPRYMTFAVKVEEMEE